MDEYKVDTDASLIAVRCEHCGKLLEPGELICLACDRQLGEIPMEALSSYPFSPVRTKKYSRVCPCCGIWFNQYKIPIKAWPAVVKWYVPQKMRPFCPRCGAVLRNKYEPNGAIWGVAFLGTVILGEFKFHAFPYLFWLHLLAIALFISIFAISGLRSYKDEAFVAEGKAGGCPDRVRKADDSCQEKRL